MKLKSQAKTREKLKKARIKVGMTQAEVAEAVGLHPNFYARAERGEENLSVQKLRAVCKLLKIKSSDILDF